MRLSFEILYRYAHSLLVLNIKDAQADRLARQLAEVTGETITRAVTIAVRERLARVLAGAPGGRCPTSSMSAARRCATLPVLDERSDDEILGYDATGLPLQADSRR
ncbi:MAG: hypothetical protein DLM61_14110 [Pseudonocardiales bacterium]|nr:MAG: hypothetical protein DLM61_14110 [Pseudonocardiales bacterium]